MEMVYEALVFPLKLAKLSWELFLEITKQALKLIKENNK